MDGIYPSLFAAPQLTLLHAIKQVDPYAAGYHLALMDLHFVDTIGLNFSIIQDVQKNTLKPLFIHLMVDNPRHVIKKITMRPNDMICFHIENNVEHEELIHELKQKGVIPFIAINPTTDIAQLSRSLNADGILVMSAQSGERIQEIVTFGQRHNREWIIAVDGGVSKQTIKKLRDAGAQIICAGSAIFTTAAQDYAKAIQELDS